jgi:hypothetical protein
MKTRQAIQRVFLSFANSDRDLARDVIRRLKDGGFTSLVTDADIPASPTGGTRSESISRVLISSCC